MEPDNKSQEVFENPEPEGIHSRGASFKSLTSYASFRSCKTYKSLGGTSAVSRSSYKSCVSKLTKEGGLDNPVFKDCHDEDLTSMYSVVEGDYHSFQMTSHQNEKQIEKRREASSLHIGHGLTSDSNNGTNNNRASPQLNQKEEEKGWVLYLGYVFSIIGGILFTTSHALVNLVPGVNSWSLLLVRCIVQILTMLPLQIITRSSPLGPKGFALRIIMQGIVAGFLLLGTFLAVQRLSLCDVSTIIYTAPLFTMVLSSLVLKEHFGILRFIVGALLISGVILIARPSLMFDQYETNSIEESARNASVLAIKSARSEDFLSHYNMLGWPLHFNQSTRGASFGLYLENGLTLEELENPQNPDNDDFSPGRRQIDVFGILAALAVSVLSGYFVIIVRQCSQVHYSVLSFWHGLGGIIVAITGFVTLTDMNINYDAQEWILLILIAAISIAGNIIFIKALSWVPPGKVLMLRSIEIISSYVLHVAVFNMKPFILDLVGTGLVLVAIITIALEDTIRSLLKFRYV